MACTLEELHQVHYNMLIKFAEYCDKHSLNYTLAFGTLLGAIRHNDIIPWDDDVDVIMDITSFKKLVKLVKTDPIEGIYLQWISSEKVYPLHFAKLRLNNTFMSEKLFDNLDVNKGVWIDIFVFYNKPDSEILFSIQKILHEIFIRTNKMPLVKVDESLFGNMSLLRYRVCKRIPDCFISFIRKILFFLISIMGNNHSEYVVQNDHFFTRQRINFEPATKWRLRDSEFRIPKNYDKNLKDEYGADYMTPRKYDLHTDLDDVILNIE